MKTHFFRLLPVLFVVVGVTCGKSDSTDPQPTTAICRPTTEDFDSDGRLGKSTYTYDSNKNLTEIQTKSDWGTSWQQTLSYDPTGRLTRVIDGAWTYTLTYDSNGRLNKVAATTTTSQNLYRVYFYEYSQNGSIDRVVESWSTVETYYEKNWETYYSKLTQAYQQATGVTKQTLGSGLESSGYRRFEYDATQRIVKEYLLRDFVTGDGKIDLDKSRETIQRTVRYDGKKSPYSSISWSTFLILPRQGDEAVDKWVTAYGNPIESIVPLNATRTYSYTYNTDGYPTQRGNGPRPTIWAYTCN